MLKVPIGEHQRASCRLEGDRRREPQLPGGPSQYRVNATSPNLDSSCCAGLQCIRVLINCETDNIGGIRAIRDECDHWGLSYQVRRGEMDRAHSTTSRPRWY